MVKAAEDHLKTCTQLVSLSGNLSRKSHREGRAHDVPRSQGFISNGTSYIGEAEDTSTTSKDGLWEGDGDVVRLLGTEHVLDERIRRITWCIEIVLH